ncbi:MAG: HIT family protein [Candidatus Woesearchaeota archaeon]
MECVICDRKFEKNILFENDEIIIMLAVEPAVNGHIKLFSKEHYTILEQTPDEIINALVSAANKISMILFEVLKVHGTNIIINNGVPAGQKIPHISVDILPRRTDDNLKLDWTLKQATPEALDSVHRIIEEGMHTPMPEITAVTSQKNNTDTLKKEIVEDKIKITQSNGKEIKVTNYHHKLFERIP